MTGPSGLHLALHESEIAGNAGAVARLCAATGTRLHLVGRLGFQLRGPAARRAGMDYWERAAPSRHATLDDFNAVVPGRRWAFTTKGERSLWEVGFSTGDVLLFGSESRGLPPAAIDREPASAVRIPMLPGTRSLNLATAAAIALYEALRQLERGGRAPQSVR